MPKVDTVLVSMPWAPPTEPSLGLGILKSCIQTAGFSVKIYHAAPRLLRYLTLYTYSFLSERWGINEFLFTAALDPSCDDAQLDCLVKQCEIVEQKKLHPQYDTREKISHLILELRDRVIPQFLRECAEDIAAYAPRIVGFSCMFDQTIASIALAKLIKADLPDSHIVLGGYALEGTVSGMLPSVFPWIDTVVLGDGEETIIDLIKERGGAQSKREGANGKVIRSPNIALDRSPAPEYDDWYDDLRILAQDDKVEIHTQVLPVESSRGCWWGEHKHCIFCGIDEGALAYRQKSAENTLLMLRLLRERHGNSVSFRFSDYILPKRYYSELLPLLAEEEPRYSLKCEIKANQTIERMTLFANAGFVELQPGIESFSTRVLRSMDKGVRGIDNVGLLKSGYENGIVINYNFLYGIPGDLVADYAEMLEQMPRIYHLIPPASRTETIITKFAPLQTDPRRFGIESKAQHHWGYNVLFSTSFLTNRRFVLDEYAYYFDRNFEYGDELSVVYRQCVRQINHWKHLHRERFVELSFENLGTNVRIVDTRFIAADSYELGDVPSRILLLCNSRPVARKHLWEELIRAGVDVQEADFDNSLYYLDEKRLLWREGDLVLGLPVEKKICDQRNKSNWTSSWPAIYV